MYDERLWMYWAVRCLRNSVRR